MGIVPDSKPKMTQADALAKLSSFDLQAYPVKILGIRGYYKQTMGNPVKNDRGIYDDALFVISPDAFASFNANTDPSVTRTGVAVLKPGGPYLYKIGMHNMKAPYEALRQYGRVTVLRDNESGEFTDTAAAPFYIDIHKGGYNTTSSLGCQTIHPTQWPSFLELVKDQIRRHNQKIIPYCLVEEA
jgi:lysozyme